jgi:hypothetical protein
MRTPLVVAAAIAVAAPLAARAAEPFVRIIEPADGTRLDAMAQNRLVYEVEPGPGGDHVHVYADDKEIGILRQLKGSHTLETLKPGPQTLCIKVVNKAHTPTGVQQCVKVSVE